MATLARFSFAVLVITGWFMAVLWIVLSVAEIAVVDATHCVVTSSQDATCSP